jgi:FkbM family methyltransferase
MQRGFLKLEANGVEVRLPTEDPEIREWLFPRYADGSPHEPLVSELLVERVDEGDLIFDIGANVGYFTALAGALCRPGGKVWAFEMDPHLTHSIRQAVTLNGLKENVETVCSAVGKYGGTFSTFSPHQEGNLSTNRIVEGSPKGHDAVEQVVPQTSLDAFCSWRGVYPDFLKIDVEGHEKNVLEGMTDVLRRQPEIVLEVHPSLLAGRNEDIGAILDILTELEGPVYTLDRYRQSPGDFMERLSKVNGEQDITEDPSVLWVPGGNDDN